MTRLISGVVLAAAALAAILFLPLLFLRILATAVTGLAADEYLRITGPRPRIVHGVLIALVMYVCWWMSAQTPRTDIASAVDPLSIVFAVVAFVVGWLAFALLYSGRTIQDAATDLVAPAYVGLPLGMLVGVQSLVGWRATLLLLGTIVVSDSAQYYTGRAFGRRPLAPVISPKKTIEGAIGGVVFGIAFMVVASSFLLPVLGFIARGVVGAAIVALGIAGDLFESRLKRTAGLKDSSSLIPGHGGVLDRIDALLFATPAFYYALVRSVV